MDKLRNERADYSVVVKNRAPPPKAWRWEIYRAGNANPIKQSSIHFDNTAAARRAGKDALNELLKKLFNLSQTSLKGSRSVSGSDLSRRRLQRSILLRQHDRDDPLGDGRIGRVG
jgi:hypothetical protein